MCFGLAPGFILREELDGDLEEALAEETTEKADTDTPSFATDEPIEGEALTGSEGAEPTAFGGTPK